MDVVSLQKVHEIWIARELVVVIAREERDTDILASPSERLEDARELADEHIELILAFDLGELPEAEGVADDHEFDLLVGLGRERLEKVDQLILEVTDAQRLVPADVSVPVCGGLLFNLPRRGAGTVGAECVGPRAQGRMDYPLSNRQVFGNMGHCPCCCCLSDRCQVSAGWRLALAAVSLRRPMGAIPAEAGKRAVQR